MIKVLAALGLAYLFGAIPFGYLLVRWKTGADVRLSGSGNIGATNVLRTSGRGAGIATLLLDILKGYAAVWAAAVLTEGSTLWTSAAAVVVMLGHAFPVFLAFRGGKAVASVLGAFLYLAPQAVGAAAIVFVAATARTRHISAGSISAAATFPLAVWLLLHPPLAVMTAAVISAGFIVWRHRSNIGRLRAGTESVFTFGSRKG